MFLWIPAFLAGDMLLQHTQSLPGLIWLVFLPVSLMPLFHRSHLILGLSGLITGFLWALAYAHYLMPVVLDEQCLGETIQASGQVTGLPVTDDRRIRFDLILTATDRTCPLPARQIKVRLSWYSLDTDLQAGDQWFGTLRLRRPRNYYNPGGFDYESYLLDNGIRYTGYVMGEGTIVPAKVVDGPRAQLANWLGRLLHAHESAGMITALVVGDRSNMSEAHYDVLRRTGTMHLMAISGLHIGMVAGIVFMLIQVIARSLPLIPLYVTPNRIAAPAALMAAAMYATLAGFTLPTQRALIMLAIFMLGLVFFRRFSAARIYMLSLLVVLAHDPFSVTQAGFWMSFSAVGVLVFLTHKYREFSVIGRWGRAQTALMIGLLPLNLLFFQGVSLLAPLANLIAIPWVGVSVLPPALLGAFMELTGLPMGQYLVMLGATSLDYLFAFLEYLSDAGLAWISLPEPGPIILLVAIAGMLILLFPIRLAGKMAGLCLMLPLLRMPAGPEYGAFWLEVLDVGDGLSSIVRTRGHTLVFDTGPRLGERFDTGAAVVAPFLATQGLSRIARLVISHSDNDHAGGVRSLLKLRHVESLVGSVPGRLPSPADFCRAGDRWQWDGVTFEFLHPDAGWSFDGNESSCVLLVDNGVYRLLLPADIEGLAELRLAKEQDIQADVLLVPHHGSKTSSSEGFLAAVRPKMAIISAGDPSRYRFPHPQVVDRYHRLGIRLLNTASAGHVHVAFSNLEGGPVWRTHMPSSRRYWNP